MRSLPALLLVAAAACSDAPTDETPSGALRLFLSAMDRSEWDEEALREAYDLLSPDARRALEERAHMASTLSGRTFEPWEMLVQGRFRLRFAPRRGGGMVERIDGERAIVVVNGSRGGERAEVPMVEEEGRWRVDLDVSPLRPEPE